MNITLIDTIKLLTFDYFKCIAAEARKVKWCRAFEIQNLDENENENEIWKLQLQHNQKIAADRDKNKKLN